MKTIGEIVAEITRLEKKKNEVIVGSHTWFYYKGMIKILNWVLYGDNRRRLRFKDKKKV